VTSFHSNRLFAALLLAAVVSLAACKHGPISTGEYVYVATPQLVLRDRVAAVYNKVGTAKNGERLEVLERAKRFVRVRTPRGEEGWVEQRNLADPDVYDGFQKLAADNKSALVQGKGKTRAELNMHLTAARDGETLYQLSDAEQVDILARTTGERLTTQEIAAKQQTEAREALYQRQVEDAKKKADREAEKYKKKIKTKTTVDLKQPTVAPPSGWDQKTPPEVLLTDEQKAARALKNKGKEENALKPFDDWWLVRNKEGKVGWVLARMIDLDIPLEIAQYAEGQRVMGAYVLNTIKDDEKGDVAQYLVVLNEPKDGTPWDFSQLRVFSWNRAKHRYETAYRERNLVGYFPVKTGTEDFGKEGVLPTFTVRKKNEDGTITDRKYRMIGPIVREVKSEGEPKAASSALTKAEREARKSKKAHKR
jgi:SH3-like domain-containing protein